MVDWALLIGVAHELPRFAFGFLRNTGVVLANARVDCEGWPDLQTFEQIEKTPDADPHAVFVPAPVRYIGKQRQSGGRRKHLPRHRLADVPDLKINDAPEHQSLVVGQLERRGGGE